MLAGSQGVEHLPDPGVLRRALKPGQAFGIAKREPHDAVHAEHLPEEDHPLGIHAVEPFGNLKNGGGGMGVGGVVVEERFRGHGGIPFSGGFGVEVRTKVAVRGRSTRHSTCQQFGAGQVTA
ncbi:MAG: hypothetical protein WD072_11605 [Pirellulales bacterium]